MVELDRETIDDLQVQGPRRLAFCGSRSSRPSWREALELACPGLACLALLGMALLELGLALLELGLELLGMACLELLHWDSWTSNLPSFSASSVCSSISRALADSRRKLAWRGLACSGP